MNYIEEALKYLLAGKLIAFPTETVYGLGADVDNIEAIKKIYKAKNRPLNHPLIVHISKKDDLSYWSVNIPEDAYKLIDVFWPGPLTLVLERSSKISDIISGGQDTVAIRCPSHPLAQDILTLFANSKSNGKGALAAPSANIFGKVSPTSAEHIRNGFSEDSLKDIFVLDGGYSSIGIESTILDLSSLKRGGQAVILRPGHITEFDISKVISLRKHYMEGCNVIVPGSLKSHYATNTTLKVMNDDELSNKELFNSIDANDKLAILYYSDNPLFHREGVDWFYMTPDPITYASKLYSTLHNIDKGLYSKIIVQDLPCSSLWNAVRDRLYKAAASF